MSLSLYDPNLIEFSDFKDEEDNSSLGLINKAQHFASRFGDQFGPSEDVKALETLPMESHKDYDVVCYTACMSGKVQDLYAVSDYCRNHPVNFILTVSAGPFAMMFS